jgi:ribosomal protein S18 acetylase RimI-like enzyme
MLIAGPSTASRFLPSSWTTERIMITDSTLEDVPHLTRLFNACSYVEPWDPTFHPVPDDELYQLVVRSLATTGADQAFRLQCLRSKADDVRIGYFHLHHSPPRLPQPSTVWISMFVIHPSYQRQQFAQEVVTGLTQQLAQCGYVAIWLEVYLKNWSALRFWIQQGFTNIIEYDGARLHTETEHASLVLEKRLKE